FSSVVPDEVGAACTAVQELIDAGHRRIGFINNSDDIPAAFGRLEGYRATLAAAGIEFDPDLVTRQAPEVPAAVPVPRSVLGLSQPPTALFCFHDRQAFGAYEVAIPAGTADPGRPLGGEHRQLRDHRRRAVARPDLRGPSALRDGAVGRHPPAGRDRASRRCRRAGPSRL
ncbi:hypothetical protein CTI14_38935, partial [Methylobacterium radiotolerans]